MRQLINAALTHTRTTLLLLVGLLLAGTAAWQAIPKEANPDVTIPIIYVSLALEGVSPEDGERLLVRPMEQELRGIEGLRKFTAQSSEGHGSVTLEFDPGFDPDTALADVRERVEPKVGDDIGMYVALGVTLHKVEPERVDFWALARDARDQLFSQVEDGGVHSLLPIQGGFLALAARLLPAKWFGAFVETAQLPGVGLTNIGRVVFDTDLSPLSIEHLSFGVSTGVLGKIGVTATTFDGTLTLNFMAMEPCITREHLNALADDVMDKLLAQL